MSTVGGYFAQAESTHTIQTSYGEHDVEIKYSRWPDKHSSIDGPEECVTQHFSLPDMAYAQYSVYEWLCKKMVDACALEKEGFQAIGTVDNKIIWSRSAE